MYPCIKVYVKPYKQNSKFIFRFSLGIIFRRNIWLNNGVIISELEVMVKFSHWDIWFTSWVTVLSLFLYIEFCPWRGLHVESSWSFNLKKCAFIWRISICYPGILSFDLKKNIKTIGQLFKYITSITKVNRMALYFVNLQSLSRRECLENDSGATDMDRDFKEPYGKKSLKKKAF